MDGPDKPPAVEEHRVGLQNFIRLSLLLDRGSEILRQIFRSRYLLLTNRPWKDTPRCGKRFLSKFRDILEKLRFCQIQRQMVSSGDVNTWDLTTIASLLLVTNDCTTQMKMENLNIKILNRVGKTYTHLPSPYLTEEKFNCLWTAAGTAIFCLGGSAENFEQILNGTSGLEFKSGDKRTCATCIELLGRANRRLWISSTSLLANTDTKREAGNSNDENPKFTKVVKELSEIRGMLGKLRRQKQKRRQWRKVAAVKMAAMKFRSRIKSPERDGEEEFMENNNPANYLQVPPMMRNGIWNEKMATIFIKPNSLNGGRKVGENGSSKMVANVQSTFANQRSSTMTTTTTNGRSFAKLTRKVQHVNELRGVAKMGAGNMKISPGDLELMRESNARCSSRWQKMAANVVAIEHVTGGTVGKLEKGQLATVTLAAMVKREEIRNIDSMPQVESEPSAVVPSDNIMRACRLANELEPHLKAKKIAKMMKEHSEAKRISKMAEESAKYNNNNYSDKMNMDKKNIVRNDPVSRIVAAPNVYAKAKLTSLALVAPTILSNSIILKQATVTEADLQEILDAEKTTEHKKKRHSK